MVNSQPDDQIEKGADPRSVEDNWQALLINHGEDVNVETAERIIRSLQSHPTLAFGDPSPSEAEYLINNAIEDVDLTEYGISDPDTVKSLLRKELREGIKGNRIGPIALSTPAEEQMAQQTGESNEAQESQPREDTESISVDEADVEISDSAFDPEKFDETSSDTALNMELPSDMSDTPGSKSSSEQKNEQHDQDTDPSLSDSDTTSEQQSFPQRIQADEEINSERVDQIVNDFKNAIDQTDLSINELEAAIYRLKQESE